MAVKDSTVSVPNLEHADHQLDWNDVHLFVIVAQCGSLRAASLKSKKSVNSIRRRIRRLEQHLNYPLLVRDSFGSHLTEQGHRFFKASQPMFLASLNVAREVARKEQQRSVCIGTTEGLGTFWLLPRLAESRAWSAQFQVDLKCHTEPPDLAGGAVDVGIQTTVPKSNDLIVTRLGYMHLQLFASLDFVARCGKPVRLEDLRHFDLVEHHLPAAHQDDWAQVLNVDPRQRVGLRTDTCCAHANAIGAGAGIGLLPTFLRLVDKRLIPVLSELHFRRDIFLTYRSGAAHNTYVRATVDWLKTVFSADRYNCFSKTFVPPQRLAEYQPQSPPTDWA